MGNPILVEPDTELIRDVMEAGGGDLKKCFQCAKCASICSLSPEDGAFPRKQDRSRPTDPRCRAGDDCRASGQFR